MLITPKQPITAPGMEQITTDEALDRFRPEVVEQLQ
jgi:hypothetical protein